MDLHEILGSIDDDILQEVLDKCEGKMGEPFAKKKLEVEVNADPAADSEQPTSEVGESGEEGEDDASPEELEELLKMHGG